MNQFKSSAALKAEAKAYLSGHYGTVIGAYLIQGIIISVLTFFTGMLVDINTIPGMVIYYVIAFFISVFSGLFTSGSAYLYLKIMCGRPVSVGDLFYGFQLCPDKAIVMQAWITLITYVTSIPQIVLTYRMNKITLAAGPTLVFSDRQIAQVMELMLPYALSLILSGVVSVMLSLIYAQAFFLLHDFPQYSAKELLKKSRRLMVHHKGRLFYLYVSFIPLILLGAFCCGIALLWIIPYMAATEAAFFLDLIKNNTEAVM